MTRQQIEDNLRHLRDKFRSAWESFASGMARMTAGDPNAPLEAACDRVSRAADELARAFEPRERAGVPVLQGLTLVGLGAGLMYFLDPERGRRRRALVRDQYTHALHEIEHEVGVTQRDLVNRARGLWAEARSLPSRIAGERVDDDVLVARVRSKMGRYASHPRAIDVKAHQGCVFLRGPILAHEVGCLLSAVASVPGVTEVRNHLDVHDQPGDISGLQGGRPRTGERPELWQANLSPTARLLLGTAGGALLAAGVRQRGLAGVAFGALGAALIARGFASDLRGHAPGTGRRTEARPRAWVATGAPLHDVALPVRPSGPEAPEVGL
jgi:hypothetical protein